MLTARGRSARCARRALALCLALASIGLAPTARGGDPPASVDPEAKDEAAAWYEVAMAAMRVEAWERAAVAFDEAAARDPAVELAWNAARAWDKAGAGAEARDRYVRFLAHEDAPVDLRRFAVKRVEALTAAVETTLARQRAVEDERLAARVAKELRAELALTLAHGGPRTAPAFTATPEDDPGDASATLTASEPGGSSAVGGWVCAGVGAVGVAVGAVMMAEAARFDGDLRDAARDTDGVIVGLTPREADALVARRDDAQTAGVASLAIGGTLLVAGVVWAVMAGGDEATAIGVAASPGGVAVTIGGGF